MSGKAGVRATRLWVPTFAGMTVGPETPIFKTDELYMKKSFNSIGFEECNRLPGLSAGIFILHFSATCVLEGPIKS
ncbi:hypothetical protein [Desulfonema ishimotonii]|uniref:hypothetical protein n=1 Tax=Desulfonema ishimotonii TaxID=45657 RepID=UPI000F573BC2|nr:hypothetical protein [Desulfonema ishimotonii]